MHETATGTGFVNVSHVNCSIFFFPFHETTKLKFLKFKLKLRNFPAAFAVELLLVGCLVEVQVPFEELIIALTRDDHLHPEQFDLNSGW